MRRPEPWIGDSAYIEWMNAMSSTHEPTLGKMSDTHLPHWPYCLKPNFGPTTRPSFLCPPRPNVFTWIVLPSSLASSGLRSKVSTCDGPPYMNRKMTALALAGNIGFLGAIGLTNLVASLGASAGPPASAGSLWNNPARPSAPNPAPVSHRNSRRVRRQNWLAALSCMAEASVVGRRVVNRSPAGRP